ncbi:MAG: hypothetical protein JWP44_3887 [Mucilaginibacter sp.]|nr:hypothetical protein [Mucilaginibacter sp.]
MVKLNELDFLQPDKTKKGMRNCFPRLFADKQL